MVQDGMKMKKWVEQIERVTLVGSGKKPYEAHFCDIHGDIHHT